MIDSPRRFCVINTFSQRRFCPIYTFSRLTLCGTGNHPPHPDGVGLLAVAGDLDARTILNGNDIFTEFKGALTEQSVKKPDRFRGTPLNLSHPSNSITARSNSKNMSIYTSVITLQYSLITIPS